MAFTREEVKEAATKLNVDFDVVDLAELVVGANHELEHADITKGSLVLSIKIALVHLLEIPDYYRRLARMEEEAKHDLVEVSCGRGKYLLFS